MKRIQRSVAVSVVCTGLLATLCQTGCHAKKEAHEDGPVFETTSPVRTDTEATREYVCQIRAIQHIELRALESGYLQNVFVDEGQLVKRGQRMFQILPTLYEAELHKAKAEAAFVEIEYQNVKKLADRNVVSPNELALAKAKLDKANAQVEMAKVHLGFTEIKAPFDGLMDRLQARRGSLLEEGDLLTTLSDNSKMWVYFNVNEAEYLDYKTQHDASSTVQLMMANGRPFAHLGKVETIEGDFHNETGTIAFRATFPNDEGLLRHGETGKILAKTPLKNVLVIPQKATFDVMDKKFVFVVDKAGVVHSKQIEVSIELQQIYVVRSGLTEQDEVMLEGLRRVKNGDKIATKHLDPKQVLAHLEVPAG